MREHVVLIGAGSAMFTRGLVADMLSREWEGELAVVDTSPEALAVAEGLARKMIESKGSGLRLRAATQRRDVLKDATAVICTIGVGGRRAWEKDVTIPRRYGIYQPVGDSVMPGGTSRALRMIPAMVDIARDVLDLAPEALFFNYGNPMPPVCRAVRKATGANIVGLCHGVFHVSQYLARVLDAPLADLRYSAAGMNHMTWFTEVRLRGEDVMPRLRSIAAERVADTRSEDQPFSWAMCHLFGAFPAVLDRHVTEFFPQFYREGAYFGKKLGTDAFSVENTIAHGDRIFEEMREVSSGAAPLDEDYFKRIGGEHEQVLEIIDSIRKDAGRTYSANLPNTGQVPNLPPHAVVECPAVADGSGMRALQLPPLPSSLVGTLATRLAWVETVVEAALEGDREKVIQALVLDGCVDSLQTAEALANDLLEAQAEHLPQFFHAG